MPAEARQENWAGGLPGTSRADLVPVLPPERGRQGRASPVSSLPARPGRRGVTSGTSRRYAGGRVIPRIARIVVRSRVMMGGVTDAYHQQAYRGQRAAVLEAAGWLCQVRLPGCTVRATTVDHVMPLAYGGTNDRWNLRASCAACNSRGGVAITNERKRLRLIGRRSQRR